MAKDARSRPSISLLGTIFTDINAITLLLYSYSGVTQFVSDSQVFTHRYISPQK